ncbi:SigE family RNA polymerase sigma factor [Intrasporangium mesophilum]
MSTLTFESFYARDRDPCLRVVTASCADRALAEDLVAEAFARAWLHWAKVSRHPNPAAWVVRTALNERVSQWRKRRREIPHETPPRDSPAPEVADADAEVAAAWQALPRRQREVIACRIFLDLDTAETARVMGITPGTVTAHLHRGVTAMRQSLTPVDSQDVPR